MTLQPGARLGPYEILSALGAGGMGEVYKARDTRLDRTVAIKVLPDSLAGDPQFRERFDREARAISQLTHPHICTLHDVGEHAGTAFLVMELLEGETLESRLKKGAVPLEQALQYAIQIASALDKAHRAGIVHRDLKPGNIMLTKAGAKLLDFGLAKLSAPVVAGAGLSMLPTTPPNLTAQGTILGTFQYMAPEQLEGLEADARTDLFAFGAVLYEMLTGKKAFEGKSQASLIGAIMHATPPPIAAGQPLAPAALDRLVRTCLAKDPDERWQNAADLTRELKGIGEGATGSTASATAPRTIRRERLAWMITAAVLLGALLTTLTYGRRDAPAVSAVRFSLTPPDGARFPVSVGLTLSPDGLHVTLVAIDGSGRRLLWVRPLDSTSAQALPGTDGAASPFWSPDSQSIGFFAEGKLKTTDMSGALPRTICDAPAQRGGTWGSDGSIVFAPRLDLGLYKVPATGGSPIALTDSDKTREGHRRFPNFLPDGRHFTYYVQSPNPNVRGIYVGSLDSNDTTRLLNADSQASYALGHLFYVQGGALMARPFDEKRLTFQGEPLRVTEQVNYNASVAAAATFSVSATGVLAYMAPIAGGGTQFAWFDRSGTQIKTVGEPNPYGNFDLSRDEKSVVVERSDPQTSTGDIWRIDLSRGVASRLTFDPGQDQGPLLSPDGSHLVFFSSRSGSIGSLYQKNLTGKGEEEILVKSPFRNWPEDWSPDGRYLVYQSFDPQTNGDLYLLPMFGDRTSAVLALTPFDERDARFSPDGKWIAYASNETGSYEVYAQKFPTAGQKWRISDHGGTQPVWRRDGGELFYVADGRFMSVIVGTGTSDLEVGQPKAILEPLSLNQGSAGDATHRYAISADGQRFLVNAPVNTTTATPITVVLNWTAGLKK